VQIGDKGFLGLSHRLLLDSASGFRKRLSLVREDRCTYIRSLPPALHSNLSNPEHYSQRADHQGKHRSGSDSVFCFWTLPFNKHHVSA
jgi:hypothetical protein